METSFELRDRVRSLVNEITGLEQYYSQKKASLIFHLDSVDDTHPILVEIANSIEETRRERDVFESRAKEMEAVEELNEIENFKKRGIRSPFDPIESEKWYRELDAYEDTPSTFRILGYWVRNCVWI